MEIGKAYFIRALTYHYTGRVVASNDKFVTLRDAAWIADSGRFATALATGEMEEVEPYPDDSECYVVWANIVDFCPWYHPLPRTQK